MSAKFSNDGSFLEQFRRRQQQSDNKTSTPQPQTHTQPSAPSSRSSTADQKPLARTLESASSGAEALGIKGGINQDVLERWQQGQHRVEHRSGGVAPTGGTVAQVEARDARDQYLLQLRAAERAQLSDPRMAQVLNK